ncbi:Golgi to ER traffic protein 4 homolog [Haliotis rufescens]|uniref:Golgi to ER traffic protein 4 homolog n=1 Tax=Haliotis rufescens TaxID=6454 RepID=UPI001EB0A1ED|nr:Golgi to ER traffic protein 4 homolog [Haliotis rufescens]
MAARGVERVLAKCQACVDAGNFYEAHQMYRTLYFRYAAGQKYAEASDLLYKGSLTLLKHNQYSSGADLALLLVNVLNSSKQEVSGVTMDRVVTLFQQMDPNCPERHNFLTSAIRWTNKVNADHKRGHPDLHQRFGITFWQEKNYAQARYHLIHSTDGKGCAAMLIEYHSSQGYPSEVDLFIAQAVLQYLCLQNKDTAHAVFTAYTTNHPHLEKGPPFVKPLLNFLWFLLLALEGGKLAVFTILCEKYEPSLKRDPSYKEYLDKIGQIFFGVPPPQVSQGLFGNLLNSLLDGGGAEDSDDDTPVTANATPKRKETQFDMD